MSAKEPIPPRNRWIFHFTHIDNIPEIVARGALISDNAARQGHLRTEVGDLEIKESRRRQPVPCGPGGVVGDYVPFYFAPRSPMMYRIACDHRDQKPGRYPGGDRPLVYLATTVGSLLDAHLAWVATDGNAAAATTEFSSRLDVLDQLIDWPLMTAVLWNNVPADPDRQRRRMAELLVWGQVPLPALRRVVTFDDGRAVAARTVLDGTALADSVFVRPDWYYGYERRCER